MSEELQDKLRKKRLIPKKLKKITLKKRSRRDSGEPAVKDQSQHVVFSTTSEDHNRLQRAVIRTVEFLGGQPKLRKLYDRRGESSSPDEDFFDAAIRLLEIDVRFDKSKLKQVPEKGPVLFVANHPYGVLDGIVLIWLAMQARPEVKILANSVLDRAPEMHAHLLPIDFASTKRAIAMNVKSRQAAEKELIAGNAIGIFPAGGVSTTRNPLVGPALDFEWIPYTARLVHRAQATVVPVYFSGQNSRLFHMASHISHTLRSSLLFRETVRRMGTPLDVEIGTPIPYAQIAHLTDRKEMVDELRRRTFVLAPRQDVDWMQTSRLFEKD